MFLGVPVLNRYDLLERLIASAEAGSLPPTGYLIVDNGGEFRAKLEGSAVFRLVLERGADVRVLESGGNIGVAAAWNAILDEADDTVIISNDDVELGRDALYSLSKEYVAQWGGDRALPIFLIADGGPDANGWCLFLHSRELYKKIGPYDESFSPAYYEDSDYRWRMKLDGIEPVLVKTEFKHHGYGSKSEATAKIMRRSLEQFERKWGGDPRGPEEVLFRQPFDGAPVAYSLRNRSYRGAWRKIERKIYRWDVINSVAKEIDAKKYLEIGIGSGESIGQVEVPVKVGIDPNALSVGGLSVLFRMTSDQFFEENRGIFDITFVDGLHHADQAYRDIENACKISRVVVVHDANPSTEEMQRVPQGQGEWTGDVWKAIARVRSEGRHAVRTVDADYGVAVVVPNPRETEWCGIATDDGKLMSLPRETYADLVTHRKDLLGLVSFDGCLKWLQATLRNT